MDLRVQLKQASAQKDQRTRGEKHTVKSQFNEILHDKLWQL